MTGRKRQKLLLVEYFYVYGIFVTFYFGAYHEIKTNEIIEVPSHYSKLSAMKIKTTIAPLGANHKKTCNTIFCNFVLIDLLHAEFNFAGVVDTPIN